MNSCLNKLSLTFFLLFGAAGLHSQVIKTGKTDNSVIIKNTNAGFDIGETEITVSYTNYFKPVVAPRGWIIGATAKAKNSDGLASWFQNGDFQPSSSLNGVLGYYWTSVLDDIPIKGINEGADVLHRYDSIKTVIFNKFHGLINSSALSNSQKTTEHTYVNAQLANKISTFHKFQDDLDDKVKNPTGIGELDRLHNAMFTFLTTDPMKTTIDDFYSGQEQIDQQENDISTIINKRKFWTFKLYGTFGINADKFSLFHSWDSTTLAKNFTKDNFRGGNIGGGFNFSWRGRWMLGVMDRYEESNNTDLLSTTKYTLETTVTGTNQTAKTSKDITAYPASDYSKVYFNSLYVDVMHYFPLQNDSVFIVADLYFRHKSSNNQTAYASNSTLGISGSIFKSSGKFVGGLYVELPDINENLAKMDPTYTSIPWYKRLSFGVYAKFSFNTLLNAL